MARKDFTGQVFGRLTAIQRDLDPARNRYWTCRCTCGNTKSATDTNLIHGKVQSCGCLRQEMRDEGYNKTHGMTGTPEYDAWAGMIKRCEIPSHTSYDRYGGAGVQVCQRWRDSFEAFYADMGQKPGPEYTLDRQNGKKGYEPGNCRWATRQEQQRNLSSNFHVEVDGVQMTIAEAVEKTGLSRWMVKVKHERGERLTAKA